MKRGTLLALALCLATNLAFAAQRHSHRGGHNFNIRTSGDANSDVCNDHLQVWSDDYDHKASAESETTVPNHLLHITAAHNGGIHVKQWDRNEIGIMVC